MSADDVRPWVAMVLYAASIVGSVLGLAKLLEKYVDRRWNKSDLMAEGRATIQVHNIDASSGIITGLREDLKTLQTRHDEQGKFFLDRLEAQRVEGQKRDDEQQRQLDEWKTKFFAQQEKLLAVQSQLLSLQLEHKSLQTDHDTLKKEHSKLKAQHEQLKAQFNDRSERTDGR